MPVRGSDNGVATANAEAEFERHSRLSLERQRVLRARCQLGTILPQIVLRPARRGPEQLSWEATYREMAAAGEDWSEWDVTLADGLDEIPWDVEKPKKKKKTLRRKG